MKLAPVKKTIYNLSILRELLGASNPRYLEFLSALDVPTDGANNLEKISRSVARATAPSAGSTSSPATTSSSSSLCCEESALHLRQALLPELASPLCLSTAES